MRVVFWGEGWGNGGQVGLSGLEYLRIYFIKVCFYLSDKSFLPIIFCM